MNIEEKIDIEDIYDKNLNFLIGAGASFGLFPTLSIALNNWGYSYETLIEEVEKDSDEDIKSKLKTLIFMAYYEELILPVHTSQYEFKIPTVKRGVIDNYQNFINSIIHILGRSNNKVCNIFTTNYDGCLPFVADRILQRGNIDFTINDGTSGFFKKQLEARNYNQTHHRTGMFSEYKEQLPTINVIPLHGSAYWTLEKDKIFVDYTPNLQIIDLKGNIDEFIDLLNDERKEYSDLRQYAESEYESDWLTDEVINNFWIKYKTLPIVNPTKEKFYETVIKEHFYQMLRLMSYEFEKEQTVFIAFGFSFADEHILSLVKRSLSNPSLQLYICCFDDPTLTSMGSHFSVYPNVSLVRVLDDEQKISSLNFSAFNQKVFTLDELLTVPQSNKGSE